MAAFECLEGTVSHVRANSRFSAAVQLEGRPEAIQLDLRDYWVLARGDSAAFLGWRDERSGKFLARAYANRTRNVFGSEESIGSVAMVVVCVIALVAMTAGALLIPFLPLWAGAAFFCFLLHIVVSAMQHDLRFQKALRASGIGSGAAEGAK
jgi:hypothetical protein